MQEGREFKLAEQVETFTIHLMTSSLDCYSLQERDNAGATEHESCARKLVSFMVMKEMQRWRNA